MSQNLSVTVKALNSGYDKHQILHGVDFAAGNEITLVIGSNGSGKSTLLKSICGLCNVYSGKIFVEQKDVTNDLTYRITRNVAYMPQTNNVFAELTISENLVIASIPDKPDWKFIFDFFPMLEERLNQKAKNLSGGQRQLLAMAMCISRNPPILLFDEPTANLSPQATKMVLEKIVQIQRQLKNCVIMVEQNVKSALDICDRCCLFASGKKIFDGTPEALLADKDLGNKFLGLDQ